LRVQLPATDAVATRGEDVCLPQIDWLFGTWAPGQKPVAPHTHAAHTDAFYVLGGTMEFRLGDGTVQVPAGSCVAAPPLLVHGFRNPGAEDARFLNLHAAGVWARGPQHGLVPELYDTFGADRASAQARPILSATGDGDRLGTKHRLALVKVQHPDLDVLEYVVDADYDGAGPHVHVRHADCFHVLEGALEIVADGKAVRAEAGTSVVIPPGVEHAFTSAGRARFLNVHAPSCGFVEYLRKLDAGDDLEPEAYDVHAMRPAG
jgi:mannose-6-phosphate isomerase-like protein (cupin superfamily)